MTLPPSRFNRLHACARDAPGAAVVGGTDACLKTLRGDPLRRPMRNCSTPVSRDWRYAETHE